MGRDRHRREQLKNRLPPFVPLLIDTLDQPAWRAMSLGARLLYVAIKRRYSLNFHNNGKLFLSQRTAARELLSHHNQIARWFRELQHFGFIVMQAPGFLGVEGKGQAPRWRLTELGYTRDAPTRDFERWDRNTLCQSNKTPCGKSRTGVCKKIGTVRCRKTAVETTKPCREIGTKKGRYSVQETRHRTMLPLRTLPPMVHQPLRFRPWPEPTRMK